jgi:hypothetical protein
MLAVYRDGIGRQLPTSPLFEPFAVYSSSAHSRDGEMAARKLKKLKAAGPPPSPFLRLLSLFAAILFTISS